MNSFELRELCRDANSGLSLLESQLDANCKANEGLAPLSGFVEGDVARHVHGLAAVISAICDLALQPQS